MPQADPGPVDAGLSASSSLYLAFRVAMMPVMLPVGVWAFFVAVALFWGYVFAHVVPTTALYDCGLVSYVRAHWVLWWHGDRTGRHMEALVQAGTTIATAAQAGAKAFAR